MKLFRRQSTNASSRKETPPPAAAPDQTPPTPRRRTIIRLLASIVVIVVIVAAAALALNSVQTNPPAGQKTSHRPATGQGKNRPGTKPQTGTQSQPPTGPAGSSLANTGPGDVIAWSVASGIAGGSLYYLTVRRRLKA